MHVQATDSPGNAWRSCLWKICGSAQSVSVATVAVRNNRQAWSLGHGHTHAHDHHVHAAVTALPALLIRGTEGETVPPDLDRETGGGRGGGRGVPPDLDRETGVEVYR